MTVSTIGNDSTIKQKNWFGSLRATKQLLMIWGGLVFIGQWFFAAYIFAQFVLPWFDGSISPRTFSHMIKGYVKGDNTGNAVMLVHLLPVFILSGFGVLQLVPQLRRRWPRFHLWNGRLFLVIGLLGAISGLWLTWGRNARLSDVGALGITLNGLLIPIAVALAWYYARQQNFSLHMRWALHAFILINAVWTFRLMLMGWFLINQGPNGNNASLDGPADITFSYLCYLLPMAVIELYCWAKKSTSAVKAGLLNTSLIFMLMITAVGVSGAAMLMWFPRIVAAF